MTIRIIFHPSEAVSINYVTKENYEIPAFYTSKKPFIYQMKKGQKDIKEEYMTKIVDYMKNVEDNPDYELRYISKVIKEYINSEIQNEILNTIIKEIENKTKAEITQKTDRTSIQKTERKYRNFKENKFKKLAVYSSSTNGKNLVSVWGVDENEYDHFIASNGIEEQIVYTSPQMNTENRIKPKDTFYYNLEIIIKHWLQTGIPHDVFALIDNSDKILTESEQRATNAIIRALIEENEEKDGKTLIKKNTIKKLVNTCKEKSINKKTREKI